MSEASSSGAPTSPMTGMIRGTRPDRYITEPRQSALTTGIRLWPRRNVWSYTAVSVEPAVTSDAESTSADAWASARRATTDSRLTTPRRIRPPSSTRAARKPRAAVSLCRFATGTSTTAVPTQESARTTSRSAPQRTPVVLPAPRTKSACSRSGSYSASVGIEVTNVTRYSAPATNDVRRLGPVDVRVATGMCTVVMSRLFLESVPVYVVHRSQDVRCTLYTCQAAPLRGGESTDDPRHAGTATRPAQPRPGAGCRCRPGR